MGWTDTDLPLQYRYSAQLAEERSSVVPVGGPTNATAVQVGRYWGCEFLALWAIPTESRVCVTRLSYAPVEAASVREHDHAGRDR